MGFVKIFVKGIFYFNRKNFRGGLPKEAESRYL